MTAENRVTKLMREYRERGPEKEGQSLWEFVAERDPEVFSHHPSGPAFREHAWEFRGLRFCKGCVVTLAGMLFGGIFFAATRWLYWFSDIQVGIIFVVLLAPAALFPALGLPRGYRHVSRFLLGFLMISAFAMLFVTESWWVRGAIVGSYLVAKRVLEARRNRMNREIAAREAR